MKIEENGRENLEKKTNNQTINLMTLVFSDNFIVLQETKPLPSSLLTEAFRTSSRISIAPWKINFSFQEMLLLANRNDWNVPECFENKNKKIKKNRKKQNDKNLQCIADR